jgi:peptide/nickel transport system substrate-binding protein
MRSVICGPIVAILLLVVLLGCAAPVPTSAPSKAPAASVPTQPVVAVPTVAKPASAAATSAPIPPTATPVPKVKRGGTIKTANNTAWTTLDPHTAPAPGPSWLVPTYADALFGFELNDKTKRFEVVPELVESWKLLDEKTYQLNLRKGVKFQDGSDWTAEVLKWNIDRMRTHPKSISKTNVAEISSVEVVDQNTAKMILTGPSASVLVQLTQAAEGRIGMVSKKAADTSGEESLGTRPVTTGPYMVTDFKKDDRVTYKRFENHWRMGVDGKPKPYADAIEERWIAEPSIALLELRSGNIHLMKQIEAKDIPATKSNPELVGQYLPWEANMRQFLYNSKSGFFGGPDNLKLRQAVAMGIDRAALVKTIALGEGNPACYQFTEGQLGYDPSLPCYRSDPEKAKQLLKEAGKPEGFEFTLDVQATRPEIPEAEVIQSSLEKIGIRMTVNSMELVAKQAKTLSCLHDATTQASNYRADPDIIATQRYYTGGQGNFACLSDKQMDALVEEGRRTTDEAQRHEVYKKLWGYQYNMAYYVPMYDRARYDAYSKKLKGWRAFFQRPGFMADLWLDQ